MADQHTRQPPGHAHHGGQNRSDHEHRHHATIAAAAGSNHSEHAGHGGHDHAAMVADFRRRFWITLILTPPVLLLSPMIRDWLDLAQLLRFHRRWA